MTVRIGAIVRPETARGLGVQTQEFVRHVPVKRTLQVDFPTHTGPRTSSISPTPIRSDYNVSSHTLNTGAMASFLSGLDVVFTAETPYDWGFLDMAREAGVKTVIQGNPEFLRHGQDGYDHYRHPDEWWWPTTWRVGTIPPGQVVPVPMPTVPNVASQSDAVLKVLHVAGKRAYGDRNGTETFMHALRLTREPMEVTVTSVDEEPIVMMPQRNIRLRTHIAGFNNRWDAYRDHHVMVLPRRYGGLCLPALEAAASGLAVLMPAMEPNLDWPIQPLAIERFETLMLPVGAVDTAVVNPAAIARELDELARNIPAARSAGETARSRTLWWDEGGLELYLDHLEALCEG